MGNRDVSLNMNSDHTVHLFRINVRTSLVVEKCVQSLSYDACTNKKDMPPLDWNATAKFALREAAANGKLINISMIWQVDLVKEREKTAELKWSMCCAREKACNIGLIRLAFWAWYCCMNPAAVYESERKSVKSVHHVFLMCMSGTLSELRIRFFAKRINNRWVTLLNEIWVRIPFFVLNVQLYYRWYSKRS